MMRSYNNNNISHFFQVDPQFQSPLNADEGDAGGSEFMPRANSTNQPTWSRNSVNMSQADQFFPQRHAPNEFTVRTPNGAIPHDFGQRTRTVEPQLSFGLPQDYDDYTPSQVSTMSSPYSREEIYTHPSTLQGNQNSLAMAAAVANAHSLLPNGQINGPHIFTSAPSKTVYLGNIPPSLTVKELLDHVRSGVVEEVKILPEKTCAFLTFVDESAALLFHSDAILKRLHIDGRDIKIGWGKATSVDPIVAAAIANDAATRNVYIGLLNTDPEIAVQVGADPAEEKITEEKLISDLQEFGEIDCIKIVEEKGIAFVHFASILSAVKAVASLAGINPYYENKKIFYGKDRCAFITKTQQHNAAQYLGLQPGMDRITQFNDSGMISNALLQQSAAAAAIATSAGGPNNLGNRTVYLGNLPKDVRIEEICNVVRGGILQAIKVLTDRHVCFVTFIDPIAAAQFYAMSSLHGITVQKRRCRVGWGKHPGPLANPIALAVSNGASRNVYIGNIDFYEDSKRPDPIFTADNLRRIFQEYGEVEQLNFLPEKNCGFVNYTNISNAILAIDKIKSNPVFKDLKINFGKDRCGTIPHQRR